MINERKFSDEKDERVDLLSNFVDANDELLEDGEQKLGEVELIGRGSCRGLLVHSFYAWHSGNIFIFYIAGHEVRTHSNIGHRPTSAT
jgi:hypothetical protein